MALSAQDKQEIVTATMEGVLQQLRSVVRDAVVAQREGASVNVVPPANQTSESNSTSAGSSNQPPAGKTRDIY